DLKLQICASASLQRAHLRSFTFTNCKFAIIPFALWKIAILQIFSRGTGKLTTPRAGGIPGPTRAEWRGGGTTMDASAARRLRQVEEHVRFENAHDLDGLMSTFGANGFYDDAPWSERHEGL